MRVTVAICTWNRAASLDRTLSTLADLRVPSGVDWELLVINNNSSDTTDQVIRRHHGRLPIRGIFEPTPGRSQALNTSIANATGDVILWTDDDVLVDSSWLEAYVEAVRAWPDAAYFGGTVEPQFEGVTPAWVRRHLEFLREPYALVRHGEGVFPLGPKHVVGANMGARLDVAQRFRYDTRLGPTGSKALRGEDTEFVGRLRDAGLLGLWVGPACVKHVIVNERQTTHYLWHWYSGLGAYTVERNGLPPVASLRGAPRWALRQYIGLWTKYALLSPLRNDAWIRSLRSAGLMRGYIDEARRRSLVSDSQRAS